VADALQAVGADACGKIVDELIEDDQRRIDIRDDGLQEGEIAGEGEGATGLGAIGDGEEGDDALGFATGGLDAGTDGVVGIVLGGEEEDAAGSTWSRLVTGEGLAAGEAGGQLAEQRALAEAGIAVEESDLAGGDAPRPEPAEWLGSHVAEADGVPEGEAALTPWPPLPSEPGEGGWSLTPYPGPRAQGEGGVRWGAGGAHEGEHLIQLFDGGALALLGHRVPAFRGRC
jgi:hypothetical protein